MDRQITGENSHKLDQMNRNLLVGPEQLRLFENVLTIEGLPIAYAYYVEEMIKAINDGDQSPEPTTYLNQLKEALDTYKKSNLKLATNIEKAKTAATNILAIAHRNQRSTKIAESYSAKQQ